MFAGGTIWVLTHNHMGFGGTPSLTFPNRAQVAAKDDLGMNHKHVLQILELQK